MVTTSQGRPVSAGFPTPAEMAVSVLMMLTDVCEANQALICSSITFARLSLKILTCSGLGILLVLSESRDAAVQIVFVGPLDLCGDDHADLQRPAARQIDRAVDVGRIGL